MTAATHLEYTPEQVSAGVSSPNIGTSFSTFGFDPPSPHSTQNTSNHHLLQIMGKPAWLTIQGGRYESFLLITLPRT